MVDTTLKAYNLSIDAIEIGVPLWKIHHIAADILKKEGYIMNYALGHGIGLSEHDSPVLRRKPTDTIKLQNWEELVVEEGMVFTIEPGAYVRGQGGIRIENDVMIRHGKVEILTDAKLIEI